MSQRDLRIHPSNRGHNDWSCLRVSVLTLMIVRGQASSAKVALAKEARQEADGVVMAILVKDA